MGYACKDVEKICTKRCTIYLTPMIYLSYRLVKEDGISDQRKQSEVQTVLACSDYVGTDR